VSVQRTQPRQNLKAFRGVRALSAVAILNVGRVNHRVQRQDVSWMFVQDFTGGLARRMMQQIGGAPYLSLGLRPRLPHLRCGRHATTKETVDLSFLIQIVGVPQRHGKESSS
jgi:hypothetical protein